MNSNHLYTIKSPNKYSRRKLISPQKTKVEILTKFEELQLGVLAITYIVQISYLTTFVLFCAPLIMKCYMFDSFSQIYKKSQTNT